VSCAAKLHQDLHVAAPQRLSLLDPLFTQKDHIIPGMSIRCGKVTSETGIGSYTQEQTAQFVEQLWLQKRVVTEVYTSSQDTSDSDEDATAARKLQTYAVWVMYKPSWCTSTNNQDNCERRAVFPLYFLSKALPPPPLVGQGGGRRLLQESAACKVPSASCSDDQLRALVEMHLDQAAGQTGAGLVWEQVAGTDTFTLDDDTFSLSGPIPNINAISPDPSIEEEVARSNAIQQRHWGLGRRWHLGNESGSSRSQLHVALKAFAFVLLFPLLVFGTYSLVRLAVDRRTLSKDEEDENDSDEDEDEDSEVYSAGCSQSPGSSKAALMSQMSSPLKNPK